MPHTWIGAEWVLSVLSLFAYEHPTDESLVLAAGIRPDWLDAGAVIAIGNLPTWYGRLDYTLARDGDDRVQLFIGGDLEMPPGGIVVHSPLPRPLARVTADGRDVMECDAKQARLDRRAANVILHY